MVQTESKPENSPLLDNYSLLEYVKRLESGGALLPDTPVNVMEVVGILKSYGVVLDLYC
jgi:CO2 hydration protein (ChpXY)